jgi:hypothetical protein
MSDDWINSRERAVEVLEGQVQLARAWGTPRIAITVDAAERLLTPRDADHCTAEERAVVEAALADRQAEWQRQPDNADIDKLIATRRDFRLAVTALLAARKEST